MEKLTPFYEILR